MFIMLRKTAFTTNNALRDLGSVDVFILCGGEGKRLRPAVSEKPKVLAEVNERPFLEILIGNLASHGFKRIILGVGYLKEQIINHFKDYGAGNSGVKIEFSEEDNPLGTGGAVKKSRPLIKSEYFMVMNGDVVLPLDFGKFYSQHLDNNYLLTMALTEMESVGDYGAVNLDKNGRIVGFREKTAEHETGIVNAGVYLMKREIFSHMPPEDVFSLERDFFPAISKIHSCGGFVFDGGFLDIGVPERYEKAKRLFFS